MRREPVVEIGNPEGRIALYLDDDEALHLAYLYGTHDLAHGELVAAVESAYPERSEDDAS